MVLNVSSGWHAKVRGVAKAKTGEVGGKLGEAGDKVHAPPAKTQRSAVGGAGAPGARPKQNPKPVKNLQLAGRGQPLKHVGWHMSKVGVEEVKPHHNNVQHPVEEQLAAQAERPGRSFRILAGIKAARLWNRQGEEGGRVASHGARAEGKSARKKS